MGLNLKCKLGKVCDNSKCYLTNELTFIEFTKGWLELFFA